MRLYFISILVLAFLTSCQQEEKSLTAFESPEALMESLPTVKPQKMTEFSSVDSLFFQFLSINTIPLEDGSFILSDWEGGFLIQIDSTGKLVKNVAQNGRGPGEILEATSISKTAKNGILAYDQDNKKVVEFTSALEFSSEFIPERIENNILARLFGLTEQHQYVALHNSTSWMYDGNETRKMVVSNYDIEKHSNKTIVEIKDKPYARIVINGQSGGGFTVPYSSDQVVRYIPSEQNFWIMWTRSGILAKVNAQFDTLKTVEVRLPEQQILSSEMDSLRKAYNGDRWTSVKNNLPERKVAIQTMRFDSSERFWLKLGYQSDYDQWLITDSVGKPQKIVQLPKGIILTHVSSHHLGVRLGPATFALYEPVE